MAPVSVLSRKIIFKTIRKVFRADICCVKKNPNVENKGMDSLERLYSTPRRHPLIDKRLLHGISVGDDNGGWYNDNQCF